MKKSIPIIIIIFLMISCAAPQRSPEDQAYLDRAMACPLTFLIEKDKIGEAWSRAHIWIAQYSTMKIQIATEYVIETYNPTLTSPHSILGPSPTVIPKYGYRAMITESSDGYLIIVQCFSNMSHKTPAMEQNAHILAYYIKSSELRPNLIYGRK